MGSVAESLESFVLLMCEEQWIPTQTMLQMVERDHIDAIQGLTDCLSHHDAEVRRLAIDLLCEAIPRSQAAVPCLIERLQDEDRLVRIAVLTSIADFGPCAVGAIPLLEPWLDDEHEFLRALARIAIATLDPDRTELIPCIKGALHSEISTVRIVARQFFGEMNANLPFDPDAFEEVIRDHWMNENLSKTVRYRADFLEDTWQVGIAPVFQEILGGEKDGERTWAPFEFNIAALFREPGMQIEEYAMRSRFCCDSPTPYFGVKGQYFGEPFVLRIHLEPLPTSPIVEVLDVIRNEIRLIENTEERDEPPPF